MADINHLITLGIGTPGDVEHFILFGLSGVETPPPSTISLSGRSDGSLSLVGRRGGLSPGRGFDSGFDSGFGPSVPSSPSLAGVSRSTIQL